MDKPDNPVLTLYIARLERDRAALLEALEQTIREDEHMPCTYDLPPCYRCAAIRAAKGEGT